MYYFQLGTRVIAFYALCLVTNLGSHGIILSAMVPFILKQVLDISQMVYWTLIAGISLFTLLLYFSP